MKNLNWESGLTRLYYVLWACYAIGFPILVVVDQPGSLTALDFVFLFGIAVVAPGVALVAIKWAVKYVRAGFTDQ